MQKLQRSYPGIAIERDGGGCMGSAIFEPGVCLFVAWLVWRLLGPRLYRPSQPAEPGDYAGRPARLRPRPKMGAGAVALSEPDEEDDEAIEGRGPVR